MSSCSRSQTLYVMWQVKHALCQGAFHLFWSAITQLAGTERLLETPVSRREVLERLLLNVCGLRVERSLGKPVFHLGVQR